MTLQAVVFDMDGVLIDSEEVWDQVRRAYASAHNGTWSPTATRDMQGMSSLEWSAYMSTELGVSGTPEEINQGVLADVVAAYEVELPMIPGAQDAVARLSEQWTLGLASSSNRELIDVVLDRAGLATYFAASVSTEEVAKGKPAPDGYLACCAKLGVDPTQSAAVEDSTNGLLSAAAAGMQVIAIPNLAFPPDPAVLRETAAVSLHDISQLTVAVVAALPLAADENPASTH